MGKVKPKYVIENNGDFGGKHLNLIGVGNLSLPRSIWIFVIALAGHTKSSGLMRPAGQTGPTFLSPDLRGDQ